MPWANGRGTSYAVARAGGDEWLWRIAIAPVIEAGPFSVMPGVDRHLVVMEDAPLVLTVDGTERVVRRGEVTNFAGDSAVTCTLPSGATRDCGLMARRGHARGSMVVVSAGAVASGRVFIAISKAAFDADVPQGSSTEDAFADQNSLAGTLDVGDALIADRSTLVEFHTGVVCAIEVAP